MTATTARNHYGIFKTKKAKLLAIKYNLELKRIQSYNDYNQYVSYQDVLFIVDNLWLDHFIYHTKEPIKLLINEYNKIFYKLSYKYPQLLN
jgi:hypothetical protein